MLNRTREAERGAKEKNDVEGKNRFLSLSFFFHLDIDRALFFIDSSRTHRFDYYPKIKLLFFPMRCRDEKCQKTFLFLTSQFITHEDNVTQMIVQM